jgi:hypothetical protein
MFVSAFWQWSVIKMCKSLINNCSVFDIFFMLYSLVYIKINLWIYDCHDMDDILAKLYVCWMVFNANWNNISVISCMWRSVFLVEETGGPEENHQPVEVTDKLCHIMLYTSPWSIFKLTTSVVIGTDCIGSCKSNYHTIMATTALFGKVGLKQIKTSLLCSTFYICIAIGHPIMKKGGWDPINWFNPATCLCVSIARTWIPMSCIVWHGLFCMLHARGDFSFC